MLKINFKLEHFNILNICLEFVILWAIKQWQDKYSDWEISKVLITRTNFHLIASRKERSVNQTEINQLKKTEYQKHWEKNEKQSLKAIFNWTDFLPPVSDYPPPGQQEGPSVPRSHWLLSDWQDDVITLYFWQQPTYTASQPGRITRHYHYQVRVVSTLSD